MSKTFKEIVLIVAVVVIAIAVPYVLPAIAPGLMTATAAAAVAAGASAFGAALTLTGVIISTLIITGLTMLATALLAPKAPKMNTAMTDRLNATIIPAAPRKIVFGETAAGADVRFEERVPVGTVSDDKPDWYYQVIALASHELTAVESFTLEDELSYNGTSVVGKYAAGLEVSHVLKGSSANAAAFGSGTYWTSTSTFTGCAYLKIRYKLDNKIWTGGMPSRMTTVVKGCPVFDPRQSTIVGGSGPMDPNDQSTWRYYNGSDEVGRNPACIMATYLLGYKLNNVPCWGLGIPSNRIDWSNFIAYANVCDEPVTTTSSGTIKRYQCDGIFDTSMSHESITAAIAAAMGSTKLLDPGGLYSLVGGHDDTAGPIVVFTADDVVGSYKWTPTVSTRDRFNIASGRFASPTDLYQLKEWGSIQLDTLPDNINRTQTFDFAAVSRAETCQRIAKQMLVRNQVMGQFAANFGPRAFEVQVGSLVYLSLPSERWNQKLFRVIDQTETQDLIFAMVLQEEDALVYAWDHAEEVALPASIKVPGYDPTEVVAVANLSAFARSVTTSTGGLESIIDLTWTVPTVTAERIEVQTKEHSGAAWISVPSVDASLGALSFKAPAGGLSTDIQARFKMASGAFGAWSSITVTAAPGTASSAGAPAVVAYLTDPSVTFAADNAGNIL